MQASFYLQRDFKSLSQTYEHLFHLNDGERSPFDSLRLEFIMEYLEWRREAIRAMFLPKERLLDQYELTKRILTKVESDDEQDILWRVRLSLSQLSNLYLISHHFKNAYDWKELTFHNQRRSVDSEFGSSRSQKLWDLASQVESVGRRLLEKLITNPQIGDSALLDLLVALGDWCQWHNKIRGAKKYYDEAYKLSNQSINTSAKKPFQKPVELPDDGVFVKWTTEEQISEGKIVLVEFDVSRNGRVSNINFQQPDTHEKRELSKFRRKFSNVRFRPKFDDKGATAVVGIRRQYELF